MLWLCFQWEPLDTAIVLVGALTAVACALPGAFLVLRGTAMLGDAISHAVLPGLAAAFIITESRDSVTMFIGAVCVGVLTAVLTQFLQHWGRVERNAAMGVVFTTLFALGLVLMVKGADMVDLDPSCVLFGSVELTVFNSVEVFGAAIPRAAITIGIFAVVNLVFTIVFFKELKITSFDPELATTVGINANVMHYTLMALVAATAVAAFESVGSIIVVAMLIVPGATALLLTQRLALVLIISAGLAVMSALGGHLLAVTGPDLLMRLLALIGMETPAGASYDTGTAGPMATVSGMLFCLAIVAAPDQGLAAAWLRRRRLRISIALEDILGLLYRLGERGEIIASAEFRDAVRHALPISRRIRNLALRRLHTMRLTAIDPRGHLTLTESGRQRAAALVRSHRLWETYLAQNTNLPADHLHDTAMALEHVTTPTMQETLAAESPDQTTDPHGRPIPDRGPSS